MRGRVRRERGFTLVELVMTITLLGIVSVGMFQFFLSGVEGYMDSAERQQGGQAGRLAVERITREVRNALPGSIRVVGSGTTTQCLEFVPVAAATGYLTIPEAGTSAAITAVDPLVTSLSAPLYAVVAASDNNAVYGTAPQVRWNKVTTPLPFVPVSGVITLSISGTSRFTQPSPAARLYLVNSPVAFCIDSTGRLTRHAGYVNSGGETMETSHGLATPPSAGVLLAENVSLRDESGVLIDAFESDPASLTRNSVVRLDIIMTSSDGEEQYRFNDEILVVNTP